MLLTRNPTRSLLLPLLFLLLGPPALAEDEEATRWYEVEVLLFVQQSQDYRRSEHWPIDYTEPQLEGSRELKAAGSSASEPVAFRRLGDAELQLQADAERINRAPDLELLAHFGWLQPGMEPEKAIPVRISDEMFNLSPSGAAEQTQPRINGTLKLMLARYLHIEADLLYREPTEAATTMYQPYYRENREGAPDASATTGEENLFLLAQQEEAQQQPLYHVYQLQESRRMRSGELHYLDHPVFGMAVKVRPYIVEQQVE
ncbi:MAG: peptidoglycan binding protein CsiV [Gammaproteobacteria bacterium]|nr:peptidoglycan binding protein CsiV [Gammaproteobacteria bacterium]